MNPGLIKQRVAVTISNVELPVYLPSKKMGMIQTVAVTLTSPDGHNGFGYSYFINNPETIRKATETAIWLAEAARSELSWLLNVERLEETLYGERADMATRAAANALSVAAWDLLGRQLGVPCYQLWNGHAQPLLGFRSGYYWDTAESSAEEKAQAALADSFRMVKVLVGQDTPLADADRIRRIQQVFPEPETVIADAFWNWSVDEAARFAAAVETPLLWFEDPVPYEQLGSLVSPHVIGTGESLGTLGDVIAVAQRGAGRVLLDIGRIGGPVRFLEMGRMLNSMGVAVGSHVYVHQSLHLLNALTMPSPVELLDWWEPLYLNNPKPDADGLVMAAGPGLGFEPDYDRINASHCVVHRVPL